MKRTLQIYLWQAVGILVTFIWAFFEGLRRVFTKCSNYWDEKYDKAKAKVYKLKGWEQPFTK